MTTTKASLALKVQERTGLGKKVSAEMVDDLFAIAKETLQRGEPLKVAGFGNFIVAEKAERKGRNPRTGESLTIGERRVVKLRYSATLKTQIRRGKAQ